MANNPLLIGLGSSAPAWYRCALPANSLDWDWIGIAGHPGDCIVMSGNIELEPNYEDYDTIIVQQAQGPEWLRTIKDWQSKGIRVIYEIDDFVHGIHKIEGHRYRDKFPKAMIKKNWIPCMTQTDGMICSTEFLAEQYSKYNDTEVCLVGIDTDRYNVEFGERDYLVVGWAGGTGHHNSVGPWLEEVDKILALYDNVRFVSIGTRYAEALAVRHPGKCLSIPWTTIENYPYALTNIDIALAPAHVSKYYKSKSDLRWLEASAVGIPTVASPLIYQEIEDESSGMIAETPQDAGDAIMELIEDEDLRKTIGKEAQEYVRVRRDIKEMRNQWEKIVQQ